MGLSGIAVADTAVDILSVAVRILFCFINIVCWLKNERAEWRLTHGLAVSLWGHMKIFFKGFIELGIVTKTKQFCDFINIHFR